jgi:NADH-quinone oxidoreductase subunit N
MFIVVALLFKLAAAPFHMWAPDVYEGSPTIVTAYFAIVPKIATLGILYQLLLNPFFNILSQLEPLLIICALLSVVVGSLGAINQTKIKRLLAYSAIGHMGFMLIGLSTGALDGLFATFIYIVIYMITSFNTFAFVLSFTSSNSTSFISQLGGLSRLNPVLALTFTLGLFSMAGIPPLAGFFSKYLVLLSAFHQQLYFVAFIAIMFSVIASFYYIRLIR